MTPLPTGLVLPESILTSQAFLVFGLFVAFNTVIYLGLTVAKFIPWPTQIHPGTVREVLPGHQREETTMVRPHHFRSAPPDDEQALRHAVARRTIPLALSLVGGLTLLTGLINTLLYFSDTGFISLVPIVLGVALIFLAQLLARSSAAPATMTWSWTVLMLMVVAETAWRAASIDSSVLLTYAVIALIVIAPITASWAAGITGAVLGGVCIAIGGYFVSQVDSISWVITSATAALASLVLLRLLMYVLARLATEQARSMALSSTDALTGALSRTGLLTLAPTVAKGAEQTGSIVTVVACDVRDMTQLNADYGMAYGDDLLGATARALRASLPPDALVARWTGSVFLAIMQGSSPSPEALTDSVESAVTDSGVTLGKRPARVTVGVAQGSPQDETFEELAAQATQGARA
jgi:diguanylate cyclase (GGDEF)-like protein